MPFCVLRQIVGIAGMYIDLVRLKFYEMRIGTLQWHMTQDLSFSLQLFSLFVIAIL